MGGPPGDLGPALRNAVHVGADEAVRFFFRRTDPSRHPGREPLLSRDFPYLGYGFDLARLGDGAGRPRPLFFEGRRPAVSGSVEQLEAFEEPAVGVSVTFTAPSDEVPPPELRARFAAEVSELVQVAAFMAVAGNPPASPHLAWMVPLDELGASALGGEDHGLPFLTAPPPGVPPEDFSAQREHDDAKGLLYLGLFLIACLNAACGRSPLARLKPAPGSPPDEPRYLLKADGLLGKLDSAGRARTLGLGHALAVCRDEFWGVHGAPVYE